MFVVSDVVVFCSHRLQDLFQQEKGRKRLSVPPSPGRHRPAPNEDMKVRADHIPVIFPEPRSSHAPEGSVILSDTEEHEASVSTQTSLMGRFHPSFLLFFPERPGLLPPNPVSCGSERRQRHVFPCLRTIPWSSWGINVVVFSRGPPPVSSARHCLPPAACGGVQRRPARRRARLHGAGLPQHP